MEDEMTVDSVPEILRLLDLEHLQFLADNFYEAEKGEQVHKRIATKFYILALCDAVDRQPKLKDLKGELKELKPEESEVRELDYDKYEDIDEKIKEVWFDRADELRSNIGIYSDWKIPKVRDRLVEEKYLERIDSDQHKITEKGKQLLDLYTEALWLQGKRSEFYAIKTQKMAKALGTTQAWKYETGEANREHMKKEFKRYKENNEEAEDEEIWEKERITEAEILLRVEDDKLQEIRKQLQKTYRNIQKRLKEIHEENAETYKDISDIQIMELLTGEKNRISDTLFQTEDKKDGLGEEEQKEIEMLLQGRY